MNLPKPLIYSLLILLLSSTAHTEEKISLLKTDLHKHGEALLVVAVKDKKIFVGLFIPASDMVGFEHEPKSDEEMTKVKEALDKLKIGDSAFKLPEKAHCKLDSASSSTSLGEQTAATTEAPKSPEPATIPTTEEPAAPLATSAPTPTETPAKAVEEPKVVEKVAQPAPQEVHAGFSASYDFACDNMANFDSIKLDVAAIFSGNVIRLHTSTGSKQIAKRFTFEKGDKRTLELKFKS